MKRFLPLLVLVFAAFSQTRSRLADYAVVLEGEPVARTVQSRMALRSQAAGTQARRIRDAQGGVIRELRKRGVAVTGATQMLVNAVTVSATRETASELRKIPGVKYVIRAPKLRPNLDRAPELMNVPAAWNAVGGQGQAGAGVMIGIIDSGIDLTHPGFQDTGLKALEGFPKGDTAYTNGKVIVARSYIQKDLAPGFTADRANTDPAAISQPDDYSPRDHIGHGTAIAMIAAGAQNTNSVNGVTIQGIAPKAYIGNYKVFGSPGLNDFAAFAAIQDALADAVADGMDIVTLSMSEGDPAFSAPLDVDPDPQFCGGPCDVYAQAVENAVSKGVVVVVSAGNSGNIGKLPQTLTSVHSPGTAPSAITVGALTNSHALYQTVRAGGQNIRARFGTGPQLQAPLTAPVKDAGLACSAPAAGSLAGAIALIQRGDCFLDEKINFAQGAGAVAAIIYVGEGEDILSTSLPAATTGIPAALIGNADAAMLKNFTGPVILDPAFTAVEAQANVVWPASSRGPSVGDFGNVKTNVVKPEIAAIGVNVYTAAQRLDPSGDAYNASGYTSVTGTSYAVPMVAGAAALVKQKNPNFLPAQIKSAIVNTASQDVTEGGGRASVNAVGAGKLDAGAAVNATFTVAPATISFGSIAPAALPIGRNLTVTNSGAAPVNLSVSVVPATQDANANIQLGARTLTVPANGQDSVTVTLGGTRPNPGSYEGFIVVTGNNQTLRVPYLYVVGDGAPADVFVIGNGSFVGGVSDTGWEIDMRVIDKYGVPVVGTPANFTVVSGGGKISSGDTQTYLLGTSAALVDLGPNPGEQVFRGTVGGPGGPSVDFFGLARPYPAISTNGVVNAATSQPGLAAGSYLSIYGTALSDALQVESTPYLPVTLSGVSVTFDADGVSQAGRLHFVSPGQVNVQIPWEFQGKASVKMKVWRDYLPSNVVTLPLAQYAPGFFEIAGLAAAEDINYAVITRAHPAKRGDVVQLFVNGLGPVTNPPATGEATGSTGFSTTLVAPSVTVGGKAADVKFSGMTPGVVGLYQVNAILAPDTPTGDQQIVISIGGVNSKTSVLPVQ